MEVHKNFSLKNYNTFAIEAFAKYYVAPSTIDGLQNVLSKPNYNTEKKLILGGGSNMLFINDFDGLVIHPRIMGKSITTENKDDVIIKAFAGENWDDLVEWTVEQGFGGLENLSLIPGTVGACPIQNIGAYGVEAGDCIEKVETIEIFSGEIKEFRKTNCQFGYRTSVFKNQFKDQYIITAVNFKLSKNPILKTHYGSVEDELKKMGDISLSSVRKAIINIRESKLPNPLEIPNAGSFFKNPIVSVEHAGRLKQEFPEISTYKTETSDIKLAAGWMIDYLGWKGRSLGDAGVHEKQALVLINKNNATGDQIIKLAEKIREDVFQTFEVMLEFEVNMI